MNENYIAIKNKKAYISDAVKIITGAVFSLLLVCVVLIFRNSAAFVKGSYSMLDFTLLFLILSGGLLLNGIKSLRNHRRMPEIMLKNYNNAFIILGDEIPYDKIKSLKGKYEFGRTGTIIIATDFATYNLYGVQNYANAIKIISSLITNTQTRG